MTNATETESQTTFKGTSCLFTRYQTGDNGIAPSLEKAYPILHAEMWLQGIVLVMVRRLFSFNLLGAEACAP